MKQLRISLWTEKEGRIRFLSVIKAMTDRKGGKNSILVRHQVYDG
ncbi:hypothetical protein [Bacillus sp. ISL-55]|nr:hypothetical protein [Bacillus sp. ISL-55]